MVTQVTGVDLGACRDHGSGIGKGLGWSLEEPLHLQIAEWQTGCSVNSWQGAFDTSLPEHGFPCLNGEGLSKVGSPGPPGPPRGGDP